MLLCRLRGGQTQQARTGREAGEILLCFILLLLPVMLLLVMVVVVVVAKGVTRFSGQGALARQEMHRM